MNRLLWIGVFFCFALKAELPGYIHFPSDVDWKVRESAHFKVLYPHTHTQQAKLTLILAEKNYKLLKPIFKEVPEKTWIVLTDFSDRMNGYALNIPWPHMVLFATPPDPHSVLADLDDWFDSLILHEMVHVFHLYPANGLWSVARFLFGSWVMPNGILPSHFHEGAATFLETHLTKGGRGTGAPFLAMRRMAVEKNQWSLEGWGLVDRMDGGASFWPRGAAPYFFGYFLNEEMWRLKGAKGLSLMTEDYTRGWPYLLADPLVDFYGVRYGDLWKNYFARTSKEVGQEIEDIRKKPLSRLEYLTESRFDKYNVRLSPDGKLVAFVRSHPEHKKAILVMNLSTKKIVRTKESSPANSLCWDAKKKGFYYVDGVRENSRLTNTLYFYDFEKSAASQILLNDKPVERIHQFSCHPKERSLLIYQDHAGEGKVRRLVFEKDKWQLRGKWKIPRRKWVSGLLHGDVDWIVVRHRTRSGIYQLKGGKFKKVAEVNGHLFDLRPGESADSFWTLADFDKRREVWAINPTQGTMSKKVAVLGSLSSFDRGKDGVVVSDYRHGGYDVAKASVVDSKSEVLPKSAHKPSKIPGVKIGAEKEYSALSTLFPRMWAPNFLFVPGGMQFGIFIPGFDMSQRHFYNLFGGYDTRGSPFFEGSYRWRFGESSNLFIQPYLVPSFLNSSQSFLQTWGLQVGLSGTFDPLGIHWSIAPEFRRVEGSTLGPSVKNVGLNISLSRSFGVETSPTAVAPVSGTLLSLSHGQYFQELGSDDSYFRTTATVTQYLEAPWWKDHVFRLRLRGGLTEGTRFYNSFFQGGGDLIFYSRNSSFLNRGFIWGRFAGRRMVSFNLDYKFPIATIDRGFGYSAFFLKKIHGALVLDILTRDSGVLYGSEVSTTAGQFLHTYYGSYGAELVTDWRFFNYFPVQLRFGLYRAADPAGQFGQELQFTMGIFFSIL